MEQAAQGSNGFISREIREFVQELTHMPEADRLGLANMLEDHIEATEAVLTECDDSFARALFSAEVRDIREIVALLREGAAS